jgi:homoserine dehydrogenase
VDEIPVIQLGLGGVGQTLIEQMLVAYGAGIADRRWRVRPRWVGVADSRGLLYRPHGISASDLRGVVELKKRGGGLDSIQGFMPGGSGNLMDCVVDRKGPPGVVVDVTAAAGTEGVLLSAIEQGWGVVLANKRPLTQAQAVFDRLKGSGRMRHEATVGAGMPVVSTTDYLLDSGDVITGIDGCLSGTLGYLCTSLEDEETFSVALHRARKLGYTEPDPREDLSGLDVARKALILARLLGWKLEMEDVRVEPLHTPRMAEKSLDGFLAASSSLDESYLERAADARARGCVLRYVASVRDGACTAGLRDVPAREPMGSLRGTDNLVAISTTRYKRSPLVVAGAGAGREVTAAAVLWDTVSLAREMSA